MSCLFIHVLFDQRCFYFYLRDFLRLSVVVFIIFNRAGR